MTEHQPWHAGRTVGRTVYQDDTPDGLIGILDTRELAAQVVADHNAAPGLRAAWALCEAALAFYANPEHWQVTECSAGCAPADCAGPDLAKVDIEGAEVARKALAQARAALDAGEASP